MNTEGFVIFAGTKYSLHLQPVLAQLSALPALVSSCFSEFGSRAFLPFIKNLDLFHKRHQSQSNLRWFLLFYECLHASL